MACNSSVVPVVGSTNIILASRKKKKIFSTNFGFKTFEVVTVMSLSHSHMSQQCQWICIIPGHSFGFQAGFLSGRALAFSNKTQHLKHWSSGPCRARILAMLPQQAISRTCFGVPDAEEANNLLRTSVESQLNTVVQLQVLISSPALLSSSAHVEPSNIAFLLSISLNISSQKAQASSRFMHIMDDAHRLHWPDVVVLIFSLIGGFVIRRLLWLCAGNAASIIAASERPRICDALNSYRSKLSYIQTDFKCTIALPFYAIAVMMLSVPALAHIVWILSHPCRSLRMAALISHAAFTSAPPSKWLQFAGDCKLLVIHGIKPPATKCPKPS